MKKILIIYASAGNGHKKAAEAVYKEFLRIKDPNIEAMPIDSLNYTTRFFKFSYKRVYIILIKYLPWLWGFFYHILNNRFFYQIAKPFRFVVNRLNSKRLQEFLVKENFDAVISTHFFATDVISRLKGKGILSLPLINIITDFEFHLYWLAKNVDKYIVTADFVKQEAVERGIAQDKILVYGVPIRKEFTANIAKSVARESLGLDNDKFTILIMGGGLGVGPLKEIVVDMQSLIFDCQIIVVCGHNKRLLSELKAAKGNFKKQVQLVGFSHNMDLIMAASNIMVSKTGALTVAESLSRELPIINISPIPGQEMGNLKFLLGEGVGFKLKSIIGLKAKIEEFYEMTKASGALKTKIGKLSRPHAASDIVKLTLEMIR
ncbi:MAG: hypothetical protein HQ572_05375 [Candidatus Omnitrophica bacterium]|nr:hypothetical protein [Candidatus Omnitrophota bacterium]